MELPDVLSFYEILGAIGTLLSAIIVFFQSERSARNTNTLIATLFGLLFTMLLAVRFDHLPAIRKQTELARKLSDLDRADRLVNLALEATRVVDQSGEPLMRGILEKRLTALESDLERIKAGQFSVEAHEMPTFSLDLIRRARSSFRATSFVALDEWWTTPWGRQYEKLNIDAVRQGVRVTRTFIISDDREFERARPFLDRQAANGIEVRTVRSSDLGIRVTSDMLVVDGSLGGELRLTPEKGMTEANFFTRRRDVENLEHTIGLIDVNAEPYQPAPATPTP
ncbi:MAG: hypothetical protein SF182_26135 [Deltaproteobacteria bacterium]|nr:hypothetical protein [Deltaproteobacteria bacterium]